MGASLMSIIQLVSKEYFFLVILAFVIAFPLTWYLMDNWLTEYAFHVELNVLTFILAVLAALILALSTVSYFALKAARTNPVEALRYE